MIFIIGGYAQGKAQYAKEHFPESEKHIIRLNEIARGWYSKGEDPKEKLDELLQRDPDAVILSEEIGSGIVPADPDSRGFREWMGRLQIYAAECAVKVIRVVCGLGQILKEAEKQ